MDADLFEAGPAGASGDAPAGARPRPWQRFDTLKARLTLGGLFALLLVMALTAWQLSDVAERDLLRQAQQREQQDVQRTAALIGRRVGELQSALAAVAVQLDAATIADPRRLADFLAAQPVLRAMSSNVFVVDPKGAMLAYHDGAGVRFPTTSIADRDYFQRTVSERMASISAPIAGKVSKEPVIVFTHPVLAGDRVLGVFGAGLRLASRDLLVELTAPRDGDGGALVVIADGEGRILAHPERGRLMGRLDDEPRLAAAYRRWVDTGRPAVLAGAADSLVVTAADPVAGWRVWRAVSPDGLLAPVREARLVTLRRAAVAALLLATLFAVYVWWQLRPLVRLERRAAALMAGDGRAQWPEAAGEIGQLTRTLRHVWAERSQMEAFNAQVLQKLASVMAAAPVGLAFTRHQRFELVSQEFCKLLGRPEADIVGHHTQLVFASNADYAALGPQVGAAFACGEPYVGEWRLLRADGSEFWAHMRAQPVAAGDPSAGTIWSVNDIHEQVLARDQLRHAARHDALTGVVNRQGFEQELQAVFAGQPDTRPAALVMIDLDHFKPINDTAGHAAGDAMLVAVAQAIGSRIRGTDLVVRLGGDEFALLLRNCPLDRAMAVAEKVRGAIEALTLVWEAHTLKVGASLGVAELLEVHQDAAQWLAQADAACYEAKRAGRGTVRQARGVLRLAAGG